MPFWIFDRITSKYGMLRISAVSHTLKEPHMALKIPDNTLEIDELHLALLAVLPKCEAEAPTSSTIIMVRLYLLARALLGMIRNDGGWHSVGQSYGTPIRYATQKSFNHYLFLMRYSCGLDLDHIVTGPS
eukprot:6097730-Amphidinium_carterae.1